MREKEDQEAGKLMQHHRCSVKDRIEEFRVLFNRDFCRISEY